MYPYKARGCSRSRIRCSRVTSVASRFISSLLVHHHFLANNAGTPLGDTRLPSHSVKLNDAQSKEIDRACSFIRKIGEKVIVPLLRSIEAEEQGRRLVNFHQRFKSIDRLKDKVADQLCLAPGCTPTEGLSVIPDAVRFTLQYLEPEYATGVRKDVDRLLGRGFDLVTLRNTWTSDQYKGINVRWREPTTRILFEVQFHTQASLGARQLTHKSYEQIRCKYVGEAEMTTLREFQRRINAMIRYLRGRWTLVRDACMETLER